MYIYRCIHKYLYNQAPAYATKVARAVSTYLTSGALDARAETKLQVNRASQVHSCCMGWGGYDE